MTDKQLMKSFTPYRIKVFSIFKFQINENLGVFAVEFFVIFFSILQPYIIKFSNINLV